jgi:hypothetical protein
MSYIIASFVQYEDGKYILDKIDELIRKFPFLENIVKIE